MLIPNKKLLTEFRAPGLCGLCGCSCTLREPHHYRTVGACGGHIDIRINMIPLGSTRAFQCDCHAKVHSGRVSANQVLERIAARERVRPEDIVAVMDFLIRLVKPSKAQLLLRREELPGGAKQLAVRELEEAKRL